MSNIRLTMLNIPLTTTLHGQRVQAFRHFEVDSGSTVIGWFQGNRGDRPELDVIVKYQKAGSRRVRTPRHIHWAVDLLLKLHLNRDLTKKFLEFLIAIYDSVQPFMSIDDRNTRRLIVENSKELDQFKALDGYGEYSSEFTAHILESMAIIERTGSSRAFMFHKVLCKLLKGSDIYGIVSAAGFVGR